jgi:hypothetical protein
LADTAGPAKKIKHPLLLNEETAVSATNAMNTNANSSALQVKSTAVRVALSHGSSTDTVSNQHHRCMYVITHTNLSLQ